MKKLALLVCAGALLAAAAPASRGHRRSRGGRLDRRCREGPGRSGERLLHGVRRLRFAGGRAARAALPRRACLVRAVTLADAAVAGGGLEARRRGRVRGAQVRLRVEGLFDSATTARGSVRGRVVLRRRGGGRRVRCKLPKLAWNAALTAPADVVEDDPGTVVDDPDASGDDPVEDDEWTEEDEDWANEDDWVPEDDEGYVWEDADAPR